MLAVSNINMSDRGKSLSLTQNRTGFGLGLR